MIHNKSFDIYSIINTLMDRADQQTADFSNPVARMGNGEWLV